MTQTLANRLTELAQLDPDGLALEGLTTRYTWRQLWWAVNELTVALNQFKNKVLALHSDNSPEWIIADLAASMSGVILLPLPTFFSSFQCAYVLEQASADAVLCSDQPGWLIDQPTLVENGRPIDVGDQHWQLIGLKSNHDALIPPDCSKITFTSGSTGHPKGVCLTHGHQERVAKAIVETTQLRPGPHMTLLPLSTLLENVAGVYAPLLNASTIICLPLHQIGFVGSSDFNVQRFIEVIEDYQPASIILLPEMLSALLIAARDGWKPPPSIQFIAVGGAKVAASLIEQADQYSLPVFEGYGLSECCSVISLNTPGINLKTSVGKPLSHADINIDDSEIVVSDSTFLGYLNQPESWYNKSFRTGDLGFFDENGYLHIQGRKTNLLISSYGRNINPEWPESETLANPMLKQCVVFGDGKPFCCALIFPRSPDIDDQQINGWLDAVNQNLPDYARIKRWLRLSQPLSAEQGQLTANGRPKRAVIYEQFESQIQSLYEESLDAVF